MLLEVREGTFHMLLNCEKKLPVKIIWVSICFWDLGFVRDLGFVMNLAISVVFCEFRKAQ
jgi:hypothetical protein